MEKDLIRKSRNELWESEKNLRNLELFHKLSKIHKEGMISNDEFKVAKTYLMTTGGDNKFNKEDYEKYYLEAIPILHSIFELAHITESQYHETIPLVVTAQRDVYIARYLRAGLINFKEFLHSDKCRIIKWFEKHNFCLFGIAPANIIVLKLSEEYGFCVERSVVSFLLRRIKIYMKKGNTNIEVRQTIRLFGGYNVYLVDESKKKHSYDYFIKTISQNKKT